MGEFIDDKYFVPRKNFFRGNPTIVKSEKLDLSQDVKDLHKALGFISNKQTIINILCTKTNRERLELAKAYKTCYDRELLEEFKRKFPKGDFSKLLVALMTPIYEYYCNELYDALNRAGTDENVLMQILCTLSNNDINEVCQKYVKNYGKTLEKDIRSGDELSIVYNKVISNKHTFTDTSGNLRKLLLSLLNATRDESMILDLYTARVDAMELKRAGIDKWGTDTSTFTRILCLRNLDQIRLISQEYEYITGNSLEKDLKKEFSGDILDALLSILRYTTHRSLYYARCIQNTIVGFGTNDKSLIRLIVTRCEIDMGDIKEAYEDKYGKSLKIAIKGDTSGYYCKALLKLIGE